MAGNYTIDFDICKFVIKKQYTQKVRQFYIAMHCMNINLKTTVKMVNQYTFNKERHAYTKSPIRYESC